MSSFLALRYIERENYDFSEKLQYNHHQTKKKNKLLVNSAQDIDLTIQTQLTKLKNKYHKIGILLSGGMDSAILASYLKGSEAYTFRFLRGDFQKEELERAEYYANYYGLKLHYVDIDWGTVRVNLRDLMISKGGPVHSIEPQICQAAKKAKSDGIELMIIGDGSDYVFGGMDLLLSKDWTFDEFYERYIYIKPESVLKNPISIKYLFERYRKKEKIDFVHFLEDIATEESYESYFNAFYTANLKYYDPYANLKLSTPLDLERIRNGESKYFIRELFKHKYPDIEVPNKNPMPRPVDMYFSNWQGPKRDEFLTSIDISKFNGNQKWLIWCLEKFLNILDEM
ncbi:asparagine synthase C-terminal domain-containing protein [Succinivibrio dextrinosolvens]|uniref:asparagine synthase-related protein n=1 Tax=Succinivibrio dextrinosolvens TaxID=83771 RepID=UPI0018CBF2A3|nr:asparagine synthase C-terminal domain-containing protein [Succinivibrio dextrinosolvens]